MGRYDMLNPPVPIPRRVKFSRSDLVEAFVLGLCAGVGVITVFGWIVLNLH